MASKQDIQAAKELAKYQKEREKALNKEKDLKDFELEMQKICKDVNVIYKDEISFLNNEIALS